MKIYLHLFWARNNNQLVRLLLTSICAIFTLIITYCVVIEGYNLDRAIIFGFNNSIILATISVSVILSLDNGEGLLRKQLSNTISRNRLFALEIVNALNLGLTFYIAISGTVLITGLIFSDLTAFFSLIKNLSPLLGILCSSLCALLISLILKTALKSSLIAALFLGYIGMPIMMVMKWYVNIIILILFLPLIFFSLKKINFYL